MKKDSLLKTLLQKIPSKRLRYMLMIALVGVLLILIGNLFDKKPKEQLAEDTDTILSKRKEQNPSSGAITGEIDQVAALEESYKRDLEEMLEKISGVSSVEVMINLDSTNVQVYEKNLIAGKQTTDEADTNGGTRIIEDRTEETQTVLVRQGDQEVPLLVQTDKPQVRGVFVIAKGVEDVEIKKWVVESVSRVLDVPTHRVSVVPKK